MGRVWPLWGAVLCLAPPLPPSGRRPHRRRLQELRGEPPAGRDVRAAPREPHPSPGRAPARPRGDAGLLRGAEERRRSTSIPSTPARGWSPSWARRRKGGPDQTLNRVRAEFLRRWNVWWLAPLGFENSWEIAVPRELAEREHLETISDLARVSKRLHGGFGHEFVGRDDGLLGPAEGLRPGVRQGGPPPAGDPVPGRPAALDRRPGRLLHRRPAHPLQPEGPAGRPPILPPLRGGGAGAGGDAERSTRRSAPSSACSPAR